MIQSATWKFCPRTSQDSEAMDYNLTSLCTHQLSMPPLTSGMHHKYISCHELKTCQMLTRVAISCHPTTHTTPTITCYPTWTTTSTTPLLVIPHGPLLIPHQPLLVIPHGPLLIPHRPLLLIPHGPLPNCYFCYLIMEHHCFSLHPTWISFFFLLHLKSSKRGKTRK